MRRAIFLLALVLAFASVALAEVFEGTKDSNKYVGIFDPDRVELYAGGDTAFGRGDSDKLSTGSRERTKNRL